MESGPIERICHACPEKKPFVSRIEADRVCRDLEKDLRLMDKILESNHHPYCKHYMDLKHDLETSFDHYKKYVRKYFREQETNKK